MVRINIPVAKDGYILGRQLAQILEPLAESVAECLLALDDRLKKTECEVLKLRLELETERRLRLGGQGAGYSKKTGTLRKFR